MGDLVLYHPVDGGSADERWRLMPLSLEALDDRFGEPFDERDVADYHVAAYDGRVVVTFDAENPGERYLWTDLHPDTAKSAADDVDSVADAADEYDLESVEPGTLLVENPLTGGGTIALDHMGDVRITMPGRDPHDLDRDEARDLADAMREMAELVIERRDEREAEERQRLTDQQEVDAPWWENVSINVGDNRLDMSGPTVVEVQDVAGEWAGTDVSVEDIPALTLGLRELLAVDDLPDEVDEPDIHAEVPVSSRLTLRLLEDGEIQLNTREDDAEWDVNLWREDAAALADRLDSLRERALAAPTPTSRGFPEFDPDQWAKQLAFLVADSVQSAGPKKAVRPRASKPRGRSRPMWALDSPSRAATAAPAEGVLYQRRLEPDRVAAGHKAGKSVGGQFKAKAATEALRWIARLVVAKMHGGEKKDQGRPSRPSAPRALGHASPGKAPEPVKAVKATAPSVLAEASVALGPGQRRKPPRHGDVSPAKKPAAKKISPAATDSAALRATRGAVADDDAQQVTWYGLTGYKTLNQALRDGKVGAYEQRTIDALDRSMRPSRSPVTVTRGVADSRPFLGDGAVGHTWTDPAFVSTEVDAASRLTTEFANGPAPARFRLTVPKGTPTLSTDPSLRRGQPGALDPHEVLLGRGLTYRVTADHGVDEHGVRQLDVEVVEQSRKTSPATHGTTAKKAAPATAPAKAAKTVQPARPGTPIDAKAFDERASKASTGQDALTAAPKLVTFDEDRDTWSASGLPERDRDRAGKAVETYWAHGQDINEYLRDGPDAYGPGGRKKMTAAAVRRTVAGVDSLYATSRLDRDAVVWRGFGGRTLFGDDPDAWPDDLAGYEWVDDGYVSTAADREEAAHFVQGGSAGPTDMRGVMARILLPEGAPVLSLSDMEATELLLSRGWTFRVARDHGWVDDVRKSGTRKQRLLDIEAVPPADHPTLAPARKAPAKATRAGTRAYARGVDVHPGDHLQHYWTRDPEGLARWANSPHPWSTLYAQLLPHIKNPQLTAKTTESWFRLVFGIKSGWRKGANPIGPG